MIRLDKCLDTPDLERFTTSDPFKFHVRFQYPMCSIAGRPVEKLKVFVLLPGSAETGRRRWLERTPGVRAFLCIQTTHLYYQTQ